MNDPYTTRLTQLVHLVEEESWPDFGFLLFRTDYTDATLWHTFLEAKDRILSEVIANAPPESGLSRITERMYLKQISNEDLAGITAEQVAIAYRSLEDADGEGADGIEPGLRTNVCLLVDEECMRSVVGGGVPFVKAVDVMLGEEEEEEEEEWGLYSGVFRVAIHALFTEFYLAQVECGEVRELIPEGNGVWRGFA